MGESKKDALSFNFNMKVLLILLCSLSLASNAGEPSIWLPLPPEEPTSALPPRHLEWTRQACIVQPWGKSQWDIMHDDIKDLPEKLHEKFGFNTIIVVPPATLKYHTGPQYTLTEDEFVRSLNAYRRAGYRIIIYSSITNCGHGPAWQDGHLAKKHLEWSQVDDKGKTRNVYMNPWLCPNTGALEFTIEYTKGLVECYKPDAVMLDNNQFMWGENGSGPTCYCVSCRQKFKEYVQERFGDKTKQFFGLEAQDVDIPTEPGDLYNLWIHWRSRAMGQAVETFRRQMETQTQSKPALFANTQYMWSDWSLATDWQFVHEDMVLSESRFLDSVWMSAKMVVGNALAAERPLWNYLGTFNDNDFTLLKEPATVARITAATMAHLSNPWLVYYGFDQHDEKNTPSRRTLAALFALRAQNPQLFEGLKPWGSVGTLIAVRSFNYHKTAMIPGHLEKLRRAGIASRGICDLYLEQLDLRGYKTIIAQNVACLSQAAIGKLARWLRQGGTLITTGQMGRYDEINRLRSRSAYQIITGENTEKPVIKVGSGWVRSVHDGAALAQLAIDAGQEEAFVVVSAANTADRFIEVRPYRSSRGAIVLHVVNHGPDIKGSWQIGLPHALADGKTKAKVYIPGRADPMEAKIVKHDRGLALQMPDVDAYGVVVLK